MTNRTFSDFLNESLTVKMKRTLAKLYKDGYEKYADAKTVDGRIAVVVVKGEFIKDYKFVTPSGLAQPTKDLNSLPKEYVLSVVG